MGINEIIEKLGLFSDKIITFNEPATQESIDAFESERAIKLPQDYVALISKEN